MARELQESLRASGKDSVNVRAIKAKVRLSAEPKEGSKKETVNSMLAQYI